MTIFICKDNRKKHLQITKSYITVSQKSRSALSPFRKRTSILSAVPIPVSIKRQTCVTPGFGASYSARGTAGRISKQNGDVVLNFTSISCPGMSDGRHLQILSRGQPRYSFSRPQSAENHRSRKHPRYKDYLQGPGRLS